MTRGKESETMHHKILPVSERRRKKQKGLEAIEFGLWTLLMMPAFVWMFINGINFVRFNKASDVTRSAAMMYIKGLDMRALGNQQVVERVANGLNLQVDNAGAVVNNIGDGMLALTKVQYLGACGCPNANNYVMMQRVYVGNRSLVISGQTVESFIGPPPSGGIWNSSTGAVSGFMTNTDARITGNFATLWGTSLNNGQIVYVVETFFKTPSMGAGEFDSRGIYSRIFM